MDEWRDDGEWMVVNRWMGGWMVVFKGVEVQRRIGARMGLKTVGEVVRGNRLRWFGHVRRKDPDDWVR